MRTLSIAAIQTAAVARDLDATWAQFETQVRKVVALRPHVDLVVVPELLLAAPAPMLVDDPDFDERAATTIPGPLTDRLGALARELDVWLVPGSLVERDGDVLYNTAVAISPAGEIVARYRKLFPWRPYEELQPGREFTTFEIPGVCRVGLAICYDGSFPEVARQLAWLGAEVIIQPTLTTTRDREMEVVMARANAFANQVFVVNLNGAAPSGVGRACSSTPRARSCSTPPAARRCCSPCSISTGCRRCASTARSASIGRGRSSPTSARSSSTRCSAVRSSCRRPGRLRSTDSAIGRGAVGRSSNEAYRDPHLVGRVAKRIETLTWSVE